MSELCPLLTRPPIDKWWKLITGSSNRNRIPMQVDRRHFEVCLFSQVVEELKSGDLCIEGSDQYADYRSQLVPWTESARDVAGYGEQVGLPVESRAFVAHLKDHLARVAAETDAGFPTNEYLRIEDGEPILGRLPRQEEPRDVKELEQRIAQRIEPLDILDVLVDTENWLNWTRSFGPISGHDAKIDASRARYVATAFCYGCNLGPSQTARSLEGYDRRQIAWVDQRHITEEKLDEAITALINAYNRFSLPKHWGSGKHASADGMKWDLYERNLPLLVKLIGKKRVGDRPDRYEPRAVKRRPKPHPLLRMTRKKAKALIKRGFIPYEKAKWHVSA